MTIIWKRFNRNSFDDDGAKIRSYVHYGNNYSNAFWNGVVMTYGDGNGTSWNPLTSIDVCGHEVTHAVTTYSAGLIYAYESGALNESFSDIFGNAIEYYADSTEASWIVGEDITVSGNGIRSMSNPNNGNDPDTYLGSYWYSGSADNGGVHTNSGVQNYWFYLLTEGGVGQNDNNDSFFVQGLGIRHAEAIAYRNLTVYLTASSDYEDARYYAIQSARDLFGGCSDHVIQTTNAWHAVGVGDRFDSTEFSASFTGEGRLCDTSDVIEFINTSVNGKDFFWDFGDGNTSTDQNPVHSYDNFGTYDVELIVHGCFGNVKDTILQQEFVVLDSLNDICNAIIMPVTGWDTAIACSAVIFDNGGLDNYATFVRDTLTVSSLSSDSIHITFTEFDYEENYDYLYVYDGPDNQGNYSLVGTYTGSNLPNNGDPILISSDAVTFVHFSDQLLVGTGFKANYKAYRRDIRMNLTPDTVVCYDQVVRLDADPAGGYWKDYEFYWNNIPGDSFLQVKLRDDSLFHVRMNDVCLSQTKYDSVFLQVTPPLELDPLPDTAICYGQEIKFVVDGRGGKEYNHIYEWNPGLIFSDTFSMIPTQDTLISVRLTDGCTPQWVLRTSQVTVSDPIVSVKKGRDTVLCQGGEFSLSINPSGGLGTFDFISNLGDTFSSGSSYTKTFKPIKMW